MLAVRDGDRRKLGLLFERYHAALYEYFCRMTGNRAASEDLVQEVFVRILKYGRTFRGDSRFKTWMYRIARNAHFSDYRRHRPECVLPEEADVAADGAGSPAARFQRRQEAELLWRAMLELAPEKREVLVLARYREMKYEEIAEILEIDPNTVKVRVHRAMKDLRDAFVKVSGEKTWTVRASETSLQII
jgi:RNA polymerase sigma-70 factor (ECF subfamily)